MLVLPLLPVLVLPSLCKFMFLSLFLVLLPLLFCVVGGDVCVVVGVVVVVCGVVAVVVGDDVGVGVVVGVGGCCVLRVVCWWCCCRC